MKVLAADRHRNGSGTEWPFTVAIVEDPTPDMPGRYLYVQFDQEHEGKIEHELGNCVAVLRLDDLYHHNNVYMYPAYDENGERVPDTGGNAWRGDRVRAVVEDAVKAAHAENVDRMLASISESLVPPHER